MVALNTIDWEGWSHHLASHTIRSTALAVRATFVVSTAGQVTGLLLSWEALGTTAILGFLAGVVDALIDKPFPAPSNSTSET